MPVHSPKFDSVSVSGVTVWTDSRLAETTRVVIAFSERSGGLSTAPYSSLNLAAHVGDEASTIDANRRRLLNALGLEPYAASLTVPEQTHGTSVVVVDDRLQGSGSSARGGRLPIAATDALITAAEGVPLMLCFADCVPVVLVAPGPVVAVVHAGWRGALASLPGLTVQSLARVALCTSAEVIAYVGPHIRDCHYEVDATTMSHFVNTFGTLARADSGGLDLEFAVTASLTDAGVAPCSIACLGTCTAEATDRFFSFRAEQGLTGRHAALACILPRA